MKNFVSTAAAIAATVTAANATGATIAWNAPEKISGDTDVSTNGSFVHSVNFANSGTNPVTINGVTFNGAGRFISRPNEWQLSGPGNTWGPANNLGSGAAPFINLSTEYQSLVGRGYIRNGALSANPTATLTLRALTVGLPYEVQVWFSDSRAGREGNNLIVDDTVNPVLNETGNGDVGTFIIGTFTATDNTQVINLASNDPPTGWNINAYQLRLIPTPGAAGLLAVAGLAAARRRR